MDISIDEILNHTSEDDCPVCQAQDIVGGFLVPAAAAWEVSHNLPRFSLAVHGAAGLLGVMLEEGVSREEIEGALAQALDDLEQQIAEHKLMGGPPQGSA
jgi:hypothetical protein